MSDTKMNAKKLNALVAIVLGSLAVAGCERDKPPVAPPPPQPTAASAALSASLIVQQQPEGAKDLAAVKKQAKAGESVVVRGRVGGRNDPIAADRAILTLLDLSVPTCEKSPMDKCPTPWDACCETPETLLSNTATIQAVDAAGQPLKTTLRGLGGIEPAKELVVSGKIRSIDGDVMVIDAIAVHVKS